MTGVALAALVPATWLGAALTDHHDLSGHTVAKGALAVTLSGTKLVTITDAVPGSTDNATVTVTNAGSVAADTVVTFNVASGGALLDAAGAIVEVDGANLSGPPQTGWSDGRIEITGLAPGASRASSSSFATTRASTTRSGTSCQVRRRSPSTSTRSSPAAATPA